MKQHNFINLISETVQESGWQVAYEENEPTALRLSAKRHGYSMFMMDHPPHEQALTMRKVYHFPFWQIETTSKRWDWKVANTRFDPDLVLREQADRFYNNWRSRIFPDAPAQTTKDGFVYVPLQGKLLDHRSFQSCSPIDMLRSVIEHDTRRKVIATLHPGETYTKREIAALDRLANSTSRLEVQKGGMSQYLQGCDYVATQNSSVAFMGNFFKKPAVLFGKIDFHHISANVSELGPQQAVLRAPLLEPDYAGYIHWFWQKMSINGGRNTAKTKILKRLVNAGWPIETKKGAR